ncbi:MAG: glycosyl transferase [Marmoricola sp.]|nr:glycosyl transferase [Marmoricola sp.]
MRILHVTDVYRPRVGGIEMFVEELAARQSAAGHDVTVLSATADRSGTVPSGPVRVIRTPPPAPWPLPFLPRRDLLLPSYDVVHAHLSVVSPFSSRVAKAAVACGTPTIATVHSMWSGREGWVRLVGSIAGWAQWPVRWTAVSSAAAASMRGPLGQDTQIDVVFNAVDVDWWRALERDRDASRPFTIAAVMRLAGRKRPLPMLEALAVLREEVPDEIPLRAVIVGEGPLEDRLRAHNDQLGTSDWVDVAGPKSRDEIRDLYRVADAYVAPSYQESFGIAALEARAAGLPVVAMRSGGVGEFVQHGVEGFLCHDDDEMVRALTVLATDAEVRERLSGHNIAHPPPMDWHMTMDGFEAAYAQADRAQTAHRTMRA